MADQTKRILCALGALTVMSALGACGDGDDPDVSIESPEPGLTFTLSDDVDEATPGVQIDVTVSVRSEEVGADVWLFTNASVLETDPASAPDLVEALPADGRVTFRATLSDGVNELLACVRECSHRSPVVPVTLVASCAGITFLDPAPAATGDTILSSRDDVDGEACGTEFTTNVRVSTLAADGTSLQLFVNGTPGPTSVAAGGQARFDGVVLGNRGDTPNTLGVTVTDTDGSTCTQDFPTSVIVQCEGVSCAITLPDASSSVLNAADDVSAEPGFQGDFEVTSDLEQSGNPVRLIVDGALSSTDSVTSGDAAVAQFGAIDLDEGRHSVVAECVDSLGNTTRTTPAIWIVDTIPCDVTIEEPVADTLFVTRDDLDPAQEGIQIETFGSVSGVGCVSATAGPCGATGAAVTLDGSTFSGQTTLGTTASQELCVTVLDDAGNLGEARVPLQVRTEAPQLEIETPSAGTQFNRLGAAGFVADLDPATDDCDVAMTVLCTDDGNEVQIRQTLTDILLGTATCVAEAGLSAPYTGRATFASVAVPSLNDGSSMDVFARMTVERTVGTSVPITLTPDCAAPDLQFFDPACGSILRPSEDDADTSTPEFDYQIKVLNPTVNVATATTVTVSEVAGGSTVYMAPSSNRAGQVILFDATFSSGGELSMEACATDPVGNTGCESGCLLSVADLPRVSITSPSTGAALNASDDCSADPGLQIQVTGTTDAPDGSTATVDVGSVVGQSVAVSGGMIDACVDAEDGGAVTVRLNVSNTEGTASAQVSVDIDSAPPTDPIDDLALSSLVDRRGGIARLSWTAVADTDGTSLDTTEIRCSDAPITNESEWAAAATFYSDSASASPGSVVMVDVGGFSTGKTLHCAIRSFDLGGGATPLAPSLQVAPQFLVQEVRLATGKNLGMAMSSAGDLDGDMIPDFVITGYGHAYIFFGRTSLGSGPVPEAPNVTIAGGAGFGGDAVFGGAQAIGDFNGDGRADFIVGSPEENSAYIFFGRSDRAAWTSTTITVSAAACPPGVLCIRGEGAADFLGTEVASAGDFNGDGISDVAIGAIGANGFRGALYVILGSPTYGTGFGANVGTLSGFAVRTATAPAEQLIGSAVTTPGSINADGRADLFVGAPGSQNGGGVPGRVRRVDGRAYSGTGLVRIEWDTLAEIGSGVPAFYGAGVRSLGDIDGLGARDIGVYIDTMGGMVEVFTGESGYTSGFSITNELANRAFDSFGVELGHGYSAVRGLEGDLDQDGLADLLIGAWETGTARGDARLWYAPVTGATTRSSAEVILDPELATGDAVTRTTNFIGDVNGDGYPDLAVGEPDWPEGVLDFGNNAGRLWIYY